jgi:hypothetical protein
MFASNNGLLDATRRVWGALAIGQILRETYLYEVHGPFEAVVPDPSRPSFLRRLLRRLSASITTAVERRSPHGLDGAEERLSSGQVLAQHDLGPRPLHPL